MKLSLSVTLLAVSFGLANATIESSAHDVQARGPMRHHQHLLQARNEDGTLKKMAKRKTCKARSSSSKAKSKSKTDSESESKSSSSSSSTAAAATKNVKNEDKQASSSSSPSSTKTSSSPKAQHTKDTSSSGSSSSKDNSSSQSDSSSGVVAAVKDLVDTIRNGEGTFFTPNTGACGWPNTSDDYIVAISHTLYDKYTKDGNPNNNSLCGRQVKATYEGKSVLCTIADRCTGCAEWDLDFTSSAFTQLAAESVGRMDIKWEFTGK